MGDIYIVPRKGVASLNIMESDPPFNYPHRIAIESKVYAARYIDDKDMFYFEPGSPKSYDQERTPLPHIPIYTTEEALSVFKKSNLLSILNLEFYIEIQGSCYRVNLVTKSIDMIDKSSIDRAIPYNSFEELLNNYPTLASL